MPIDVVDERPEQVLLHRRHRLARQRERRASAVRSLRISVTSAASAAMCVPDAIAIPTSACASAGASFNPSPTIATTLPLACSRLMASTFRAGAPRRSPRRLPAGAGDGLGRRPAVASQHDDAHPQSPSAGDDAGGFGRSVSAIANAATVVAVDRREHGRLASRPTLERSPGSARRVSALGSQKRLGADDDARIHRRPRARRARQRPRSRRRPRAARACRGEHDDRRGKRMLGASLDGADPGERLRL